MTGKPKTVRTIVLRPASPQLAFDLFATFLYAISAEQIIAANFSKNGASFVGLLMVLFLFLDWLSRVWLPWRLPYADIRHRSVPLIQLAKSCLEIAGLYCLVTAFLMILQHSESAGYYNLPSILRSEYAWFAMFLLITLLWNLLMLAVMRNLSVANILDFVIRGTAVDSEHVTEYAGNLTKLITKIDDLNRVLGRITSSPGEHILLFPVYAHPSILRGILCVFLQVFVFHLLIGNLLISA